MRILFSHGLIGRGGDAIQVNALIEVLVAIGHDVKLVGPHKLKPYEFQTRSSKLRSFLRRFPWWAKDFLELELNSWTFIKAKRLLRCGKFDLIFHRAGIYDMVGVRLAKIISCPLIAWLDAPFPLERAFRGEGYFKGLHHQCMRKLGQRARLIVTISQASKEYYTKLGLSEEKILVVPNGITERLLQKCMEFAQKHPPLSSADQQCIIGFVGSLASWHRVDLLLKALTLLKEDRYCLLVVGYGAEYSRLRALAKDLGIEKKVNWLGPMPHEQTIQEMARFDVAVLPGTLSTGAPIKLFEYAALARPTIAPDLPNLRAWFADDEMRFIKPEDPQALAKAILSLCDAPEEARRMGLKAQARVAEYTWEKIVQRILEAACIMGERRK